MKSETKTKLKLLALANLVLASCWGFSCATNIRDAVWAGTIDYITGTTTGALEATFSVDDLFPEGE